MSTLAQLPKHFSSDVWAVLRELFQHSFHVTLIGGATRDFIINESLSNDLDFEIRHKDSLEGEMWEHFLNNFFQNLSKKFPVEKLAYNVYKIKLTSCELEFSSPRLEIFRADEHGHSNFDCVFSSDLSYDKAFKRRDFTCNAIGLEIRGEAPQQWNVVDPFNGLNDIANKRLHYCSDDFTKDPVRFLRAIRFHLKLQFELSSALVASFRSMNLIGLSTYYLFSENKKSNSLLFFKEFFHYVNKFELILSKTMASLCYLGNVKFKSVKNEIEIFMQSSYQGYISKEEIQEQAAIFGIKKKIAQSLYTFMISLKRLDEEFLGVIKTQDFQQVKNLPDFLFAHSVVNFIDAYPESAELAMSLVDKKVSLGDIGEIHIEVEHSERHLLRSYLLLRSGAIFT